MISRIPANPLLIQDIEFGVEERKNNLGKPYLKLHLESSSKSADMPMSIRNAINQLRSLAKVHNRKDKNTIVLTGARCVAAAIKLLKKHELDVSEFSSSPVLKNLSSFDSQIKNDFLSKKRIPSKGKKAFDYILNDASIEQKSMHKVSFAARNDKTYVFKEYNGNPLAEVEAFESMCYRWELAERTPKIRTVYDDNNIPIGNLITYYPDYQTLEESETSGPITERKIIDLKYADVWWAAYNNQESDLHDQNQGTSTFEKNQGKLKLSVKIDNDRSTYTITAAYTDKTLEQVEAIKDRFNFTRKEIRKFPTLVTTQPARWPGMFIAPSTDILRATKMLAKSQTMERLHKNKVFNDQKYTAALRRLLIPDTFYYHAAEATISSKKLRTKLYKQKINNTKKLTEELTSMPEFKEFLQRRPEVIDEIIAQFKQVNADYNPKRYGQLRLNLDTVHQQYKTIYDTTMRVKSTATKSKYRAVQAVNKQDIDYKNRLINFCEEGIAQLRLYLNKRSGVLGRLFRDDSLTKEKTLLAENLLKRIESIFVELTSFPSKGQKLLALQGEIMMAVNESVEQSTRFRQLKDKSEGELDKLLNNLMHKLNNLSRTEAEPDNYSSSSLTSS